MVLSTALRSKDKDMAIYYVRLHGENFLIDDVKGPRKKRFQAARLVDAETQEQAEALARNLTINDPRIKNHILNKASDPPVVYIESVREVPAMAYDAQNRANSFYWEKENNQ